ncbi:unnamed protein product [Rhodiola kirilowii]
MNVNGDADGSDDDDVVPVFDSKNLNVEDAEDEDDEGDYYDPGLVAMSK